MSFMASLVLFVFFLKKNNQLYSFNSNIFIGRLIRIMMKDVIEEQLYRLEILPLSNIKWKKFDLCLYSDSSNQEYLHAKKKIRECVPKGTSGVYILNK